MLFAHAETIGNSGTGTFTQYAGTNTVGTGGLLLANNANSTGSYTLLGTASLSASSETIGANGTATFIQTGGFNTITSSGLTLANGPTSAATYYLFDPAFLSVTGNETLANATNATAAFIQSGGIHTINAPSTLTLAAHAGATASYTLLGDGQLNAYAESIGNAGTATFDHSAGLNTIGKGGLTLGNGLGANGTYSLLGSAQLSSAGNETLAANGGTATFYQSGGINSIAAPSALIIGIGGSTANYLTALYLGPHHPDLPRRHLLPNRRHPLRHLPPTPRRHRLLPQHHRQTLLPHLQRLHQQLVRPTRSRQRHDHRRSHHPHQKHPPRHPSKPGRLSAPTHPATRTGRLPPTTPAIASPRQPNLSGYTTFNGQPVDANSILLTPEFLGDANADGTINLADLSTILNNFGCQSTHLLDLRQLRQWPTHHRPHRPSLRPFQQLRPIQPQPQLFLFHPSTHPRTRLSPHPFRRDPPTKTSPQILNSELCIPNSHAPGLLTRYRTCQKKNNE